MGIVISDEVFLCMTEPVLGSRSQWRIGLFNLQAMAALLSALYRYYLVSVQSNLLVAGGNTHSVKIKDLASWWPYPIVIGNLAS